MYFKVKPRQFFFSWLVAAALLLSVRSASAQLTDVVVGITPNCPYGFPGCWPLAKEALEQLDDKLIVAETPDSFNCTAVVRLKHGGLPDLVKMAEQFNRKVGTAHTFRGVEVTVVATVLKNNDGEFILKVPGLKKDIALAPLKNKLQWNFKKRAARQPEPDEAKAYGKLSTEVEKAKGNVFQAEVTGPLRLADQGLVLEVREYFSMHAEKSEKAGQRD